MKILMMHRNDILENGHTINVLEKYPFLQTLEHVSNEYRIAQNGGGGKLWRIGNFKNWMGKTLANCNELSLYSIKRRHSHAHAKLKYHNRLFYRHVRH